MIPPRGKGHKQGLLHLVPVPCNEGVQRAEGARGVTEACLTPICTPHSLDYSSVFSDLPCGYDLYHHSQYLRP